MNESLIYQLYLYWLNRVPTQRELDADTYNLESRGFDSVVATLRWRAKVDAWMVEDILDLYDMFLGRDPDVYELASEIENYPKYGRDQLISNLRERANNQLPRNGEDEQD